MFQNFLKISQTIMFFVKKRAKIYGMVLKFLGKIGENT